jgi:hypothetical protein
LTSWAADARRADDTADAAAAAAEPPTLFVKRGSRHYIEIHRTKLKPDEPLFTRIRPTALIKPSV